MGKRIEIVFRVQDGEPKKANGQEARTLLALVAAGPKGITSLETFKAGWAVRLGAYVFDLKSKMGVPISMFREPHDGGYHARYKLVGHVEILAVSGHSQEAA